MPGQAMPECKKYPVLIPSPSPIWLPASPSDRATDVEARELKTYVKDWLTVEEFESLMPGRQIIDFMCYEAVGPESWTINLYAEDVLSCESSRSVQSQYIQAVHNARTNPGEVLSHEQIEKIARSYKDISPDALLFLIRLHEYLNEPDDNYDLPQEPDEATLAHATDMMVEHGVKMYDLIKAEPTEQTYW